MIPPIDTLPDPPPLDYVIPPTLQALVRIDGGQILGYGLYPVGTEDESAEIVNLDESLRATLELPGLKYLEEDGSIRVEAWPVSPPSYEDREREESLAQARLLAATDPNYATILRALGGA